MCKQQLQHRDVILLTELLGGVGDGSRRLPADLAAGYDPASGVEFAIKPEFNKANKPVKGFETGRAADSSLRRAERPGPTRFPHLGD